MTHMATMPPRTGPLAVWFFAAISARRNSEIRFADEGRKVGPLCAVYQPA